MIAAASAMVGAQSKAAQADVEGLDDEVAALLRAFKNQAYATGLVGGAIGSAPFTAGQIDDLTALLLREHDGSELGPAADQVKLMAKAGLTAIVNGAYVTGKVAPQTPSRRV